MTDRYVVDFTADADMPSWWSNYVNKTNLGSRAKLIENLAQENIVALFPSFNNRRLSFLSEADFLVFKLKWI